MSKDIHLIRARLNQARRDSGQLSYGRRAPALSSVVTIQGVLDDLRAVLEISPTDIESLRMLSEAHECLLQYAQALVYHDRATELAGSLSARDLKRRVLLQEADRFWSQLGLTPCQLRDLGEFLESCETLGCSSGDYSCTAKWLRAKDLPVETHVAKLGSLGAFSDTQVLHNLVSS